MLQSMGLQESDMTEQWNNKGFSGGKWTEQWNNKGFSGGFSGSDGKESACNARDLGSMPGWGRSPGEGNGNPLSILACWIPWTEEPDRLYSSWSCKQSDPTELITL